MQVCIGQIGYFGNLVCPSLNQFHPRWNQVFWRFQCFWSLFRGESSIPINRPVDEMSWPTSCNGKVVHQMVPFKLSNPHYNLWEASWLFEVTINSPLKVSPPEYGWTHKILFCQNRNKKQYEVTIGNFPTCTCLNFVTMMSNLLGWQRKWVPFKHMYYVLYIVVTYEIRVFFEGAEKEVFSSIFKKTL
jgi:hypothetical protein